jgi:hypothetical protein
MFDLNVFKDVLWDFRYVALVVICFVVFFAFERQRATAVLYSLMLQAKRMAKDLILTSGKEQEDWVVEKAKLFLPREILLFLPDDRLRIFVRFLFNKLKDKFDDGKVNNSYDINNY